MAFVLSKELISQSHPDSFDHGTYTSSDSLSLQRSSHECCPILLIGFCDQFVVNDGVDLVLLHSSRQPLSILFWDNRRGNNRTEALCFTFDCGDRSGSMVPIFTRPVHCHDGWIPLENVSLHTRHGENGIPFVVCIV